ncbi:GGDEF domain-containing protein [Alteromonas lipotrueiana]|uniref:GGDEF domain-containing protein n=1 Tax=Alteromonas lipotrueiana TaxID=2803815 RepID=UPI001C43AD16|nr:GGDEF domain-containing protein [Alteromonas lipotrueiana]
MNSSQLQSLQHHNEMLAQFVIRLSKFFEGYSADIDSELLNLRGHLAGHPNFTLASVSMGKLNTLFQSDIKNVRRYNASGVALVEQSVRSLQQRYQHDANFQAQAASVLTLAGHHIGSMPSLLKVCLNGLSLVKQLPKHQPGPTDTVSTTPLSAEVTQSLQKELHQLLESYRQLQPDNPQLSELRHRLLVGLDDDDLLQACLGILRLIVKDSMGEAAMSGEVIQSLHEALGSLTQDVEKSIEQTQHTFTSRMQHDAIVKEQLHQIEDVVATDNSLEELKAQAQQCLDQMASTLAEREQREQDDKQCVMTLLSQMQGQLAALESQVQGYRKQLSQQHDAMNTDVLTGLPNRQAYNEKILTAQKQACPDKNPLCLAVLDIDHFKNVNDRFGHAAGDKILQIVAQKLQSALESNAFIARWGGEEFVLLFENTPITELQQKLEQLRTRLMDLPFTFRQERLSITASFGGAMFNTAEAPEQFFERADKKLYEAKRSGRNCVVIDEDGHL